MAWKGSWPKRMPRCPTTDPALIPTKEPLPPAFLALLGGMLSSEPAVASDNDVQSSSEAEAGIVDSLVNNARAFNARLRENPIASNVQSIMEQLEGTTLSEENRPVALRRFTQTNSELGDAVGAN